MKLKVVFIQGPTASGKSQLALQLAQKYQGVIVNCDSIQLYQRLDIGSAKPSPQERELCPHFLFDYVPAGTTMTAGQYGRDFFATLDNLKKTSAQTIFVVGGTGFYFQAIEKGMFTTGASDPQMMAQVEAEIETDAAKVYRELQAVDPETAAKVAPADHYRLARAIEIWRTHGISASQAKKSFEENQKVFPYPLLKLGVWASRETLLPRVQERTRLMLQQGLENEVAELVREGYGDWPPLQSVGYKEMLEYLRLSVEKRNPRQLQEDIVTATLQLAKKQRTWFKRDQDIHWLSSPQLSPETEAVVDQFLAGVGAS